MSAYRRLLRMDADLLRDHLLRLDAESRMARFYAVTSDATIRKYVDSIDWDWARFIGYFQHGQLHAVAEIRFETATPPKEAELAFSVERGYQNGRIGTNLMSRALILLSNRKVRRAHIVCLLSNGRMQRLALRHRANVRSMSGEVFLTLDVPHGDIGSLLSEITDEYICWMSMGWDLALSLPLPGFIPPRRGGVAAELQHRH